MYRKGQFMYAGASGYDIFIHISVIWVSNEITELKSDISLKRHLYEVYCP